MVNALLLLATLAADSQLYSVGHDRNHVRALDTDYTVGKAFELTLEPVYAFHSSGLNGLQVVIPSNQDTEVAFGLNLGLGFYVTPVVEPRLTVHMLIDNPGGHTDTTLGLVPSVQFNFWTSARLNPFVEPFVGVLVAPAANYLDAGGFVGIEWLWLHNVGLRLWSGLELLVGGGMTTVAIPARWALAVYF